MNEISIEAEQLLNEIISHESDFNYWSERFKGLNLKDDTILRGCFKELIDNNLISVFWADNMPCYIQVLKDGYLFEKHKKKQKEKDVEITNQMNNFQNIIPLEYDVFISHADKDKEDYVESLYKSLSMLGINIFYDKQSLEWGDNWKDKIIDGTKKSEFAIIVISQNFFGREWTKKELSEFLNRQNNNGQKIILPILHNITIRQLKKKYPSIADIQAIDSSKYTCDQIALLFAKQFIKRLKNI